MDVITPTGRPTRIVLMMLYETMIKTLLAFGIFVYIIVICRLTSLVPVRCKFGFRYVIFKLILVIGSWNICCETALIWLLPDLTMENWTLVQLMASCGQAASHNSYQYCPSLLTPCGAIRGNLISSHVVFMVASLTTQQSHECPYVSDAPAR